MIRVVAVIPSLAQGDNLINLQNCVFSLVGSAKSTIVLKIAVVSASDKVDLPHVDKWVRVSKGTGFGESNNIAINNSLRLFKCDYLLLINDDAWVKNNFFLHLLKVLKKEKKDVICPIVMRADGSNRIDSFGVEYLSSGLPLNATDTKIATSLFAASCVLISRKVYSEVLKEYGYFFENFYNYYIEDVELAIRMYIAGVKIFKSRKLIAFHHGQHTSKKIWSGYFVKFYSLRNILWTIFLTWPRQLIFKYFPKILIIHLTLTIFDFSVFLPAVYLLIIAQTFINRNEIIKHRAKTLRLIHSRNDFEKLLSRSFYRMRKNRKPFNKLSEFVRYIPRYICRLLIATFARDIRR